MQSFRPGVFIICTFLGCGLASQAIAQDAAAAYRAAVAKRFTRWVEPLRIEAMARGIAPVSFTHAMKGVTLDWTLPDLAPPDLGEGQPERPRAEAGTRQKQQAEFGRPAHYFQRKSLKWGTRIGRENLSRWKHTLTAIEKKYGVEGHIVLAIWGSETAYGRARLPYNAVRTLATQAFMGRRREQFREELIIALGILQDGHVTRKRMRGSWAGAMGHTQFLPSDFREYAVDFDGDGQRDIWGSIPDALASTANFLSRNGWRKGRAWGYEVRLPEGFDCTLEGFANARSIAAWVKLGVARAFGRKFPGGRLAEKTHLLAPAGTLGPAFLVLENFEVLRAYNKADLYALYVGHIADRILSGGDFEGAWSPVAGFSRDEMKRLQRAAARAGYDAGKIDGLMGSKTRSAIGKWQRQLGREITCYPPRALLKFAAAARE